VLRTSFVQKDFFNNGREPLGQLGRLLGCSQAHILRRCLTQVTREAPSFKEFNECWVRAGHGVQRIAMHEVPYIVSYSCDLTCTQRRCRLPPGPVGTAGPEGTAGKQNLWLAGQTGVSASLWHAQDRLSAIEFPSTACNSFKQAVGFVGGCTG
jgi:hypothetical protein